MRAGREVQPNNEVKLELLTFGLRENLDLRGELILH